MEWKKKKNQSQKVAYNLVSFIYIFKIDVRNRGQMKVSRGLRTGGRGEEVSAVIEGNIRLFLIEMFSILTVVVDSQTSRCDKMLQN